MLPMEIKSQNTIPTGNGNKPLDPGAPLDSTAETVHASGADWQEEIYQKIKVMKESYLPEINEMYQRIDAKLQQHDSHPQQPKPEQLEKLKVFKAMLERLITFLQVSKNNIKPSFKEKLGSYEKQILSFLNPSRFRKPIPNLQQGHASGADWQEEIYQKIKVMKESYLPEINEMYQRIDAKLQQHDSHPQQPKPEQLEKLKVFKAMLERLITFLQVSKTNITPNFKDKLGSYEKRILSFLNPSRFRKPIPNLQQGQLPQPHVQPMQQPQYPVPQLQSHENQLNPQLQSMNVQGSIPTMQQNNMSSLQHGSLSSLSGVSTSQPNMMNTIQPGSNLDSGQGNALRSLQQTSVGSAQQNSVSSSQPTNADTEFGSLHNKNLYHK